MLGRKKEVKDKKVKPVELTDITEGRSLADLRKVISTRNCEVFEVNKDVYFTLLNEKLRGNLHDIEHAANTYGIVRQVLKVRDIVADKGTPIGYSTDSYDMTLGEYFIKSDPDVYTTRIILQCVRDKVISLPAHGDLSLDNIVLKDGEIYVTNRFLQEHVSDDEFEYLGKIEKELLTLYRYPKDKEYLHVEEADKAIYDYLYYLLINTSGEERKKLINAGLESCYKTLFDDIPNKNIEVKKESYEKYDNVTEIIKLINDEEYIKKYGLGHRPDIRMF